MVGLDDLKGLFQMGSFWDHPAALPGSFHSLLNLRLDLMFPAEE